MAPLKVNGQLHIPTAFTNAKRALGSHGQEAEWGFFRSLRRAAESETPVSFWKPTTSCP
jgi:hypothetical protein